MITIADLDRALDLMQCHGLQTLRVREGDALLALHLAELGDGPALQRQEVTVTTKALGRLRLSHPQYPVAMAKPGDTVEAQTILGFLENGSVLLPIVAGAAGELLRFEAVGGALLGFGTPVATVLLEG